MLLLAVRAITASNSAVMAVRAITASDSTNMALRALTVLTLALRALTVLTLALRALLSCYWPYGPYYPCTLLPASSPTAASLLPCTPASLLPCFPAPCIPASLLPCFPPCAARLAVLSPEARSCGVRGCTRGGVPGGMPAYTPWVCPWAYPGGVHVADHRVHHPRVHTAPRRNGPLGPTGLAGSG